MTFTPVFEGCPVRGLPVALLRLRTPRPVLRGHVSGIYGYLEPSFEDMFQVFSDIWNRPSRTCFRYLRIFGTCFRYLPDIWNMFQVFTGNLEPSFEDMYQVFTGYLEPSFEDMFQVFTDIWNRPSRTCFRC